LEESDVTHLDGNSIAGLLEQLFGRDMTVAFGRCSGCGAERELGALYVYRAAGVVVRCPDCDTVLLRIVEGRDRTWVDARGVTTMQIPG
jgi:ribosomal protein S27E